MFQRRLLLERTAHRLGGTADNFIDVARHAAYASPDAFTRAFSRTYGATPTDYVRVAALVDLAL